MSRLTCSRNAVELIVSILALTQNQIVIVQTSLIGSMLSNLLLVMGMCFFFGGINRKEQFFNVTVAQTAASLLALAIGSLIIPAAFNAWANNGGKLLIAMHAFSKSPTDVFRRYGYYQGQHHRTLARHCCTTSSRLCLLPRLPAQDSRRYV